ncbi:histidine phosphatase family protein [Streptomyces europaeiscabiei]|uniref:histidine phosphatase family protein n=1 Tax=Streptomyces europaeiscabiei TaxID=146819 RepID=UPI002E1090D3|nr:histidine phosphatase family protein [Streptomyces europaeiscabiei]
MDVLVVRHAHDLRLAPDDRPLSPLGHAQAAALTRRLRHGRVTDLWSSPSERARQTATPLASALRMSLRCDPRLDEICNDREGTAAPPPRERASTPSMDGVEGWPAFLLRVSCFLGELCAGAHEDQRVVIVTHSGVFDAMHEVLTGAGCRVELEVDHTAITAWRYRPGSSAGAWLLRRHNDISHLRGEAWPESLLRRGGA